MAYNGTVRAIWLRIAAPGIVCVVFVLMQLTAGSQWTLFPDSYRYARAAKQYAGSTREEAHRAALEAFCRSRAERAAAKELLRPVPRSPGELERTERQKCLDRWRNAPDITTGDPRYQAIFSSRPGYPLLAAPFVAAFGVLDGLRLLGLLTGAAASLLVVGVLRSGAGLSLRAAVFGQIAFLASPPGWWSVQALSEGLATVCTLVALWGAVLLLRRRVRAGTALLVVALAAGSFVRYSSALVLAVFLAAAAVGALCCSRRLRHLGTWLLAGLCVVGAAADGAAIRILGLPSTETTLQDKFTHHFQRPDVADPWGALWDLAARYWTHWLAEQAGMPFFLVLTAMAAWALIRYGDGLGWPALAAGLTGAATVTAHPLVQEADRLGIWMWIPIVLGLPLLADRIRWGTTPPAAYAHQENRPVPHLRKASV